MASADIRFPRLGRRLLIHVVEGDVLKYPSEVLAVKYAQRLYGVDFAAVMAIKAAFPEIDAGLPRVGASCLFDTAGMIAAAKLLVVGVPPLLEFRYREIRGFSREVLSSLVSSGEPVRRLTLTVHGPGFGLDEMESFESLVAGLLDALVSGTFPSDLAEIAIVERNPERAARFEALLDKLVQTRIFEINQRGLLEFSMPKESTERIRAAGYASDSKPLMFVAMPFRDDMKDHYKYGMQNAATRAGFLCERADYASFTGDIFGYVKSRIEAAKVVVADLSYANPNVFLEVGYAWGREKPTILLVRDGDKLPFDVQSQRCLIYKLISDIEDALYQELTQLPSAS